MPNLLAPDCLHIGPLREGGQARIAWGAVEGAEGYILERHFNETFEQAASGRTWSDLDAEGKPWETIGQEGKTWEQWELPPACGLSWENIGYFAPTWDAIEKKALTWDGWALQLPHFEIYRGPGSAETGYTWTVWEEEGFDWGQSEAKGQAWGQWENGVWHRSAMDTIGIGAKSAIYRVAACGADGIVSESLTGSLAPVTPILYREDSFQWPVKAGERYWLFINGDRIREMERVPLAFRYNAGVLALENFAAQIPDRQTGHGAYPSAHLRIVEEALGEVRFVCTRAIPEGKTWTGLVTAAQFIAKKTGMAGVGLH